MKFIATLIVLLCFNAFGLEVPPLTSQIVDQAGIISTETTQMLKDVLEGHEARTSNQIAILTIKSLEGDSLENFATKVFQEWKLGQKGKDNGILFLTV